MKVRCMLALVTASFLSAAGVHGQEAGCSYRECAVAIVPVWNGLEVVRLSDKRAIANLNFFLPADISSALAGADMRVMGADSALVYARHAVALRRVGAVLTDLGGIALAAAAIRAAGGNRMDRGSRAVGIAGMAAIAVSVPFQFAADGALSRAVWWHNLRYSR